MTRRFGILAFQLLFALLAASAESPPVDTHLQTAPGTARFPRHAPIDEWRFHGDIPHPEDASLYAQSWNWKDALTVRHGYELSYSLLAHESDLQLGSFLERHSFLEMQGDNAMINAIKKAEGDDAFLVGFYEWVGKENDFTLRPDAALKSAVETDLIKRPLHSVTSKDSIITVRTKPPR